MRELIEPGDIVKVKLSGDVYEVEVVKSNAKTIWVKAQFIKVRLAALSPKEKEEVARMPQSTEGLSEEGKVAAALARAGKKVRHERGTKIVKLARGRVVEVVSQRATISKSEAKRLAVQHGEPVAQESDDKQTSKLSTKERLKAKLAAKRGGETK